MHFHNYNILSSRSLKNWLCFFDKLWNEDSFVSEDPVYDNVHIWHNVLLVNLHTPATILRLCRIGYLRTGLFYFCR